MTEWRDTAFIALLAAFCLVGPRTFAIQVTEPVGAQHGYPSWRDLSGQKLADGEFRQSIEKGKLSVVITYKFKDGRFFEEKSLFRQQPELVQEKWSWKELKDGKRQREFTADFLTKTASGHIENEKEPQETSGNIDVETGRTFAGFGFTLALSNLRSRLIKGEQTELKVVTFGPKPFFKPMVVPIKVWHVGIEQMKMAGRYLRGDNFGLQPQLSFAAKLLVHVPDTHIWLTNPTPAGFLRWEGPIVLANDEVVRVDLIPDGASGPAEPTKAEKE